MADFGALINKVKGLVGKNPSVVDKGADAVNKATGNKYEGVVDKGADAVKKFAGEGEAK